MSKLGSHSFDQANYMLGILLGKITRVFQMMDYYFLFYLFTFFIPIIRK